MDSLIKSPRVLCGDQMAPILFQGHLFQVPLTAFAVLIAYVVADHFSDLLERFVRAVGDMDWTSPRSPTSC